MLRQITSYFLFAFLYLRRKTGKSFVSFHTVPAGGVFEGMLSLTLSPPVRLSSGLEGMLSWVTVAAVPVGRLGKLR